MVNKTILLLTVCLLATATFANIVTADDEPQEEATMEMKIKYYFAAIRGSIQGFMRGFYNNADFIISGQCLDKNAYNLFDRLYMSWITGSFINPFQTFSIVYQLNFMIDKSCNTDQIIYDLSTFCTHANCDFTVVLANAQAKVFKVIGTLNDLAEILSNHQPDYSDLVEGFDKYDVIGESFGKTIRILFDYQ